MSDVQERRLANGARLLLVERRGLTAFHAALVFRGGRTEEPTALAGATDLLARALYGSTWPEDIEPAKVPGLDGLLQQEEGLMEAVRLERLRLRRDPAAASQLPSLEASLASLQSRMKGELSSSPLADLYAVRGGRQGAEASADALVAWSELPEGAFEFWCRTEAQRLTALQLSHFSAARANLEAGLNRQGTQGLALLLGAALPGHPYGRDLADYLPVLEAFRRSDLKTYAQKMLSPDRLTIILIGGFSLESVLPLVERHLGALPTGSDSEDPILPEIPSDLGDRRVQAALGGVPRLLVGWRIPPRSHPDHLALRLAVQLLAGGPTSRLPLHLVQQKGLALDVRMTLDEPGGRLPGLLVADLHPADGHGLEALERALHSEILHLQQDPIPQEEWQRAVSQLETEHLRLLDDPSAMAEALGKAWVEGGDWRLAHSEILRLRTLGPEAIQTAARTWLTPSHRTTAWLEAAPDTNLDPLDANLARVLRALAAARIEDPAQREHLVAEGLRQLRMLSTEERTRTLKLMEAQLLPAKP
jgi:zinc protease